jgi:DNA-binding SARP family transcriptional activator
MLGIRLFGRWSVADDSGASLRVPSGKPSELLCYLLLHRKRRHSREVLASLLWGDCTTSHSKKYLRQTIWQIQDMIAAKSQLIPVILVDRESISFNPEADVWLDVAVFEDACLALQNVSPLEFNPSQAETLRGAIDLYRGELLEGWYQDWCLFERERLQNLYLLILDKLIAYSEAHQQYTSGLELGERILQIDRAHERTYQAMMRLHYQAGDRGGALRLFQRCTTALREELGIRPGRQTLQILDQIRVDSDPPAPAEQQEPPQPSDVSDQRSLSAVLGHLKQVLTFLSQTQSQLEERLRAVDRIGPTSAPAAAPKRVNER